MKTLIKGVIFLGVEFYFYTKTSPSSLETFFFGWGFLFVTLFLYNAFSNTFQNSSMSTAGGDKGNLINVTNQHRNNVEKSIAGKNGGGQMISGIRDRVNLLYLVLFLINVIGYIQVMPK